MKRFWRLTLLSLASVVLFIAATSLVALALSWEALGEMPQDASLKRCRDSELFVDGKFINPQRMHIDYGLGGLKGMINPPEAVEPSEEILAFEDTFTALSAPADDLRVTWFGHSSLLIELDGKKILTDPIWGERTSPLIGVGPKRWYQPALTLEELKALGPFDAVLISHDHYDHLDHHTISVMQDWPTLFVVPLGVDSHLRYWGVPEARIQVVDWWDELAFGEVKVIVSPARHASGRQVFDQMKTLWAGYIIVGSKERVFYSGDTGYFDELSLIGEKYGPFDLTMIEVGAYNAAWPDWHMGPEQAVYAHQALKGAALLPIHWGLFNLAPHGWTEPMERTLIAAEEQSLQVASPRPGEPFYPGRKLPVKHWWPEQPFKKAKETPIVATKSGDPQVRYQHQR